jgi:MFS transporter, SP family, general alpha glucoside:H+ symporter
MGLISWQNGQSVHWEDITEDMTESKPEDEFIEELGLESLEIDESAKAVDFASQLASESEHGLTFREAIFQRYPKAAFWAMAIAMTIVMEGYTTILYSNLLAYPTFAQKYGTYFADLGKYEITTKWQNALGNGQTVGCLLGLTITGTLTERFGHRMVIVGGLALMIGFNFLLFFAPNVQVLLAGQILIGLPYGSLSIMGSMYSSEVCPLVLRGFLTSFVNICWVTGQLICAGVLQGLVNNNTEWSYRIPFAINWAWPLPLILLTWLAPDSPYWLIRKGRIRDAEHSLRRLTSNATERELRNRLAMMVHTDRLEKNFNTESSLFDCFKGVNLRRTEVACMALSSQTLCGQPFAYSSTYFLTQAGLNSSDVYKLNFGSTALSFLATCISWVIMSYSGRRRMIIIGLGLLTLDLLVIAVLYYPGVHHDGAIWAEGGLSIVWLGIYSCFIGPVTFTTGAEVSATKLRSQTLAIARLSYYLLGIITSVSETYLINPTAANLQGKTGFIWFATTFLTTVWAIFRLTETKNLTYEELDILFNERVPAWRFSRDNPLLVGGGVVHLGEHGEKDTDL